jgi:hypothetical protein
MLAREELKFDAAIWQIAEIYLEGRDMVFRYANRPRAEHLARLSEGKLRLVDDQSAYLRLGSGFSDPDAILRIGKIGVAAKVNSSIYSGTFLGRRQDRSCRAFPGVPVEPDILPASKADTLIRGLGLAATILVLAATAAACLRCRHSSHRQHPASIPP